MKDHCLCRPIGGSDNSVYGPGPRWDITWLRRGIKHHSIMPAATAMEAEYKIKTLHGDDTVIIDCQEEGSSKLGGNK